MLWLALALAFAFGFLSGVVTLAVVYVADCLVLDVRASLVTQRVLLVAFALLGSVAAGVIIAQYTWP